LSVDLTLSIHNKQQYTGVNTIIGMDKGIQGDRDTSSDDDDGLEIPRIPVTDLFWVQITQSYYGRLKKMDSPCGPLVTLFGSQKIF
jgi:hypothetical protein